MNCGLVRAALVALLVWGGLAFAQDTLFHPRPIGLLQSVLSTDPDDQQVRVPWNLPRKQRQAEVEQPSVNPLQVLGRRLGSASPAEA